MKIIADVNKCIGAGQCARVAGKVFTQAPEDGLVILLDEHPSATEFQNARNAARLCPAAAIQIVEE
jgi:ferredoxin